MPRVTCSDPGSALGRFPVVSGSRGRKGRPECEILHPRREATPVTTASTRNTDQKQKSLDIGILAAAPFQDSDSDQNGSAGPK